MGSKPIGRTSRANELANTFSSFELMKMLWKARLKFLGRTLLMAVPGALLVGFFAREAFDWFQIPFNVSIPIVLVLAILSSAILIVLSAYSQSGREADELAEALSIKVYRDMFE